jgi:O-antigen/teichoic acid export membrane protein
MSVTATVNNADEAHSLLSRFRKGVTWNIVAALLTQGSNFLTTIVIANLLGRELFGQYGLIQSTLLTLAGMAQIATGVTATKYLAELRARDKIRAGRVLGLCSAVTLATGVVACTAVLLGSTSVANRLLHAPSLAMQLRLTAIVALFTVINGYQAGALAGLERYKTLALGSGIQGALQVALSFILARHYGLTGALLALVSTSIARWAVFHVLVRLAAEGDFIHVTYRGLRQELTVLHRFAVPAAVAGLMSPSAIWLANVFLVRGTGGYGQLALFNAAFNLKNVVMFLPLLLNTVGMSLLNNQFGSGNATGFRRVFWANIALTGITSAACAVVMVAFGQQLLHLYGRDFAGARTVLLLLACSSVLETIGIGAYQLVQAREKMWLSLFTIAFPRDALLVIVTWRLAAAFGALGLAMAWTLGWAVCTTATFVVAYNLGLEVRSSQKRHIIALPAPN